MKLVRSALVSIAAVVLAGCGGGGGDGASVTNEKFVGHWLGAWMYTGSAGNQYGSSDITVNVQGEIAGTLHNSTQGTEATVSGQIVYAGDVSAACTYTSSTMVLKGRLAVDTNGHMTGPLSEYDKGTYVGTVTFDYTKH